MIPQFSFGLSKYYQPVNLSERRTHITATKCVCRMLCGFSRVIVKVHQILIISLSKNRFCHSSEEQVYKIKGSMVWFFFSETFLAWTLDAFVLCVHVVHVCFGVSGVSLFGCVEVSSYKDVNGVGLGSPPFVYRGCGLVFFSMKPRWEFLVTAREEPSCGSRW